MLDIRINNPKWLQGFQDKLSYLVFLSLYPSLFWKSRQKKLKKLQFWPESLGAMLEYWYIKFGLLNILRQGHYTWKPLISHLDISLQDFLFLRTDKLDVGVYKTLPSGQGAIGIQAFYQLKRTLDQFLGKRVEELVCPMFRLWFCHYFDHLLNSPFAVPLAFQFL